MKIKLRNQLVFMFHKINSKKWFEKTILNLSKFYKFVNYEEFFSHRTNNSTSQKLALITFDDGDRSFYTEAFPVLLRFNIPAILFISPAKILLKENFWFDEVEGFDEKKFKNTIADYLGIEHEKIKQFPSLSILKSLTVYDIETIVDNHRLQHGLQKKSYKLITLSDLKEISTNHLVSIGAHTQNHPILANENENTSRKEIFDSINGVAEMLNREVMFFAYPNGLRGFDYGEKEKNILAESSIKYSFATNLENLGPIYHPLEIPRIGLSHGSAVQIFSKIVMGSRWNSLPGRNTELINRINFKKNFNI